MWLPREELIFYSEISFVHEKELLLRFLIYLDFAEGICFARKKLVPLWRSIFTGYSYIRLTSSITERICKTQLDNRAQKNIRADSNIFHMHVYDRLDML